MNRYLKLILLAIITFTFFSCKKSDADTSTKLTLENTQWINITLTEELEQQETTNAAYIMDFDLTQEGILNEAVVIIESSDNEIPVGSNIILKSAPYTAGFGSKDNVTCIQYDGIFYGVKDEGNNVISLKDEVNDKIFYLKRVETPYTLIIRE